MRDVRPILQSNVETVVVLDIETGNDPAALAILQDRASRGERAAIQRVRSACVLVASCTDRASPRLLSFHANGEDELLEDLAAALAPLVAYNALLVTYDGRRHDLPILRRRAGRHMLFDRTGLTWWSAGAGQHLDLARDIYPPNGSVPPLREACAGFDIALPEFDGSGNGPLHAQKGQLDCVATYLLFLHEQALFRGDGKLLLEGWRALSAMLASRPELKHLRQMTRPAGLRRSL